MKAKERTPKARKQESLDEIEIAERKQERAKLIMPLRLQTFMDEKDGGKQRVSYRPDIVVLWRRW